MTIQYFISRQQVLEIIKPDVPLKINIRIEKSSHKKDPFQQT